MVVFEQFIVAFLLLLKLFHTIFTRFRCKIIDKSHEMFIIIVDMLSCRGLLWAAEGTDARKSAAVTAVRKNRP